MARADTAVKSAALLSKVDRSKWPEPMMLRKVAVVLSKVDSSKLPLKSGSAMMVTISRNKSTMVDKMFKKCCSDCSSIIDVEGLVSNAVVS